MSRFLVSWLDPIRRRGVVATQQAMQRLDPAPSSHPAEPSAQRRVPTRPGEETAGQRPIVEPATAHDHRKSVTGGDLTDHSGGVATKARSGVDLGRLGDVDQMVRDTASLRGRDLVGTDIEASVDGRRVAIDDFTADLRRDR